MLETRWVFLELIRKFKARICELEFSLSTKWVIGLIGTDKSCPLIVEINSVSIDGQTWPWSITGPTTRAFPRPLLLTTLPRAFPRLILLTTPRVLDYSDDIVFLSHPPHFVYQLPAPLPDNSIIIATVVRMCILLFIWRVRVNRKTRLQTHRPNTPRRV